MSKAIFVVLSDELFEKLEKFKERIDISDVCSRALMEEIEKLEKEEENTSDKQSTSIDVEISADDYLRLWKMRGVEDGKRDSEEFSYRAFMEILNVYKNLDTLPESFSSEQVLPGEIYDTILYPRLKELEDVSPEKEAYLKGWVEGVLRTWEKVKNRF